MTDHARRALDAAFAVFGADAAWTPAGAQAPAGTVRIMPAPLEDPTVQPSGLLSRVVGSAWRFKVRAYEDVLDAGQDGTPPAEGDEFIVSESARGDLAAFAGRRFKVSAEPLPADRLKLSLILSCHDPVRFAAPQA